MVAKSMISNNNIYHVKPVLNTLQLNSNLYFIHMFFLLDHALYFYLLLILQACNYYLRFINNLISNSVNVSDSIMNKPRKNIYIVWC